MIGHTLSVSDLLLIEKFQEAFGKDDKKTIERILRDNGMDVTEPYSLEYSRHRNLRGNIVSCERYVGEERNDKEWLDSGAASWECIIENCDLDLRIQLKTMNKQLNTGDFIDYAKKHSIGSDK